MTALGPAPPVTACLLSWKRPANLERIVADLTALPMIDEILVWNNDPQVELRLPGSKARVLVSPTNLGCAARFLCAAQARNEVVYTQDDDVRVLEVPRLYEEFLRDPSRITFALNQWHFPGRDRHRHPDGHVALLGFGSFFLRRWVQELDRLPEEVRRSPLYARQADTYFTVWLHRQHHPVLVSQELLPGHSDPATALWRQPEHAELFALGTREALRLAREEHRPHVPVRWHVVVPCRDYGGYLEECVRSVVLNEVDSWVTIVDDASMDDSRDVARALVDHYGGVELLEQPRSRGPGAAANRGIAHRDSVFVVRLDADDRVGPDYLLAADRLLTSGTDVANPDAILVGDETGRWDVPTAVELPALLSRNPVHCASAFRRSFWAQVGGYDEDLTGWEDYDFWLRLSAGGARIRRVPGDHFYYRRHPGSRSFKQPDPRLLEQQLRSKNRDIFARKI